MTDEGKLSVQGIVTLDGRPLIQFRQRNADGTEVGWQQDVEEAREHAQLVFESAANATYEAALVGWLRDELKLDDEGVFAALRAMRIYRQDRWGQPDIEDWRER